MMKAIKYKIRAENYCLISEYFVVFFDIELNKDIKMIFNEDDDLYICDEDDPTVEALKSNLIEHIEIDVPNDIIEVIYQILKNKEHLKEKMKEEYFNLKRIIKSLWKL